MILLSFNSIKVRLRQNEVAKAMNDVPRFQFHKGTIKTNKGHLYGLPRYYVSIP